MKCYRIPCKVYKKHIALPLLCPVSVSQRYIFKPIADSFYIFYHTSWVIFQHLLGTDCQEKKSIYFNDRSVSRSPCCNKAGFLFPALDWIHAMFPSKSLSRSRSFFLSFFLAKHSWVEKKLYFIYLWCVNKKHIKTIGNVTLYVICDMDNTEYSQVESHVWCKHCRGFFALLFYIGAF